MASSTFFHPLFNYTSIEINVAIFDSMLSEQYRLSVQFEELYNAVFICINTYTRDTWSPRIKIIYSSQCQQTFLLDSIKHKPFFFDSVPNLFFGFRPIAMDSWDRTQSCDIYVSTVLTNLQTAKRDSNWLNRVEPLTSVYSQINHFQVVKLTTVYVTIYLLLLR